MIETEDVTTLVTSVKDNAQKLGLTWGIRFGSVTDATHVLMDGTDTVPIEIISLIGSITSGMRVAVMAVQPSGQYVIGMIGPGTPGLIVSASAVASTSAITAETVTLTTASKPFYAGRCYEARILGNWVGSIAAQQGLIKLRISGGGTIAMDQWTSILPTTGAFTSMTLCGQFQVATSRSMSFDETLMSSGAGTITDLANASGVMRRVQIWDIGPASSFTNLRSI